MLNLMVGSNHSLKLRRVTFGFVDKITVAEVNGKKRDGSSYRFICIYLPAMHIGVFKTLEL